MKKSKLSKLILKLSEKYGEPFRYKAKAPGILDVLIATKLSQNTTDKSSYKAFINLKNKFPDWNSAGGAKISEIKNCIKVCGLANTKATDIKKMLLKMKRNYGSLDLEFLRQLDDENVYAELLQYDGLGVKTISCVLIFAMGRDAFPVDTHVHRVLNRTGVVNTKSPVKTFEEVKYNIPAGKKYLLHSGLIKFGRNICRSNNPLCSICFFYNECGFPDKKLFRNKKTELKAKDNNFIILENI